jgi:hypothetical protein
MTNTQDGAEELSDMDEMIDGILLNDLGSSITEALHDRLEVTTTFLPLLQGCRPL